MTVLLVRYSSGQFFLWIQTFNEAYQPTKKKVDKEAQAKDKDARVKRMIRFNKAKHQTCQEGEGSLGE